MQKLVFYLDRIPTLYHEGLLFNQIQVENGRSFRVRSCLESVPELKRDYFLSFESLSSFKFVIMQKLVFYLDRIPTCYRDGIDF